MNEIENLLQQYKPIEPSAKHFEDCLRIFTKSQQHVAAPTRMPLVLALAVLCISLLLNLYLFLAVESRLEAVDKHLLIPIAEHQLFNPEENRYVRNVQYQELP